MDLKSTAFGRAWLPSLKRSITYYPRQILSPAPGKSKPGQPDPGGTTRAGPYTARRGIVMKDEDPAVKTGVPYWHVWTDEDGVSRQARRRLTDFALASISEGAAPSWIKRLSTPAARVVVLVLPAGWVGEWHENPEPQWIVPLSGRWFVETMDGARVEMGPGDLSFGGDQNTRPDAHGRRGHRSGTVGSEPAVLMLVQMERGRPE